MIGLHIAVDGYGLARPRAGVAVYTKEILHALAVDRPDCRMTVFLPAGVKPPETNSAIGYRPLPDARLVEIPDSYTLIMRDQPQRFATEIRSFVREAGGAAPQRARPASTPI